MPPRLNLKQRLAALSQATSSPTAPRSHSFESIGPQISTETLKRKLNIPWGRKDQSQDGDIYQDDDAVRDVISKMIFQAGVDYEWVAVRLHRCAHLRISQNKANVGVEIRGLRLCVLTFVSVKRVVINASALPDPQKFSYDVLLSHVTSHPVQCLNLIVL
jgi:Rho GTPase-activating protein 1